jgi:NAD(P)H-nitrite reductase large subunit
MSLHHLQAADRDCPDPCAGPCSGCPDRVVCRCLKVTEGAIVDAIITLGLATVKQVSATTGAGGGCTCCHTQIRELLAVHAQPMAPADFCVSSQG